jgi:hypothetical protein
LVKICSSQLAVIARQFVNNTRSIFQKVKNSD